MAHSLLTQMNALPHSSDIYMFSRCIGQQAVDCEICAGHIKILVQARYLEGSR